MNKVLSLSSDLYPGISLRAIGDMDQSNLLKWKNENRESFFFKGIITPNAQQEWFKGYLRREQDYMFIVCASNNDIGCMGVRFVDNFWDIYNVILGNSDFSGSGYMSRSFQILCNYALQLRDGPISAKVLKINPALGWYIHNSFQIVSSCEDYVEIQLDRTVFRQFLIEVRP